MMRGDARRYRRDANNRANGKIDSSAGDDEHHPKRDQPRFSQRLHEKLPVQRRPKVAAAVAGVDAEK